MNGGYQENVQWVTLISVLVCYGYYFAKVLPPSGPDVDAEQVAIFTGMVVLLIVLNILGAIVTTALERFNEPEPDERDRLVGLIGGRNASWVLALGTCLGMVCAFYTEGNFWVLHVLLASLVMSQLVESVTAIFYYRRGF